MYRSQLPILNRVYLVVHEFEFRVGQQDLEKIFIFPDSQATAKNQKCNFNHINEFERPAVCGGAKLVHGSGGIVLSRAA